MSSCGIYISDFGPLEHLLETILRSTTNAADFLHFNLFVVHYFLFSHLSLTVIFTEQCPVRSVSMHFVKTLRRVTTLAAELRLQLLSVERKVAFQIFLSIQNLNKHIHIIILTTELLIAEKSKQ